MGWNFEPKTLSLALLLLTACRSVPDNGVELVYDLPEARSQRLLDETRAVVARRLLAVGARNATATLRGEQIVARLPAGERLREAKAALARRGRIELRVVDDSATQFLADFDPDSPRAMRARIAVVARVDAGPEVAGLPGLGDLGAEAPAALPAGVRVERGQLLGGSEGPLTYYSLVADSEAELRKGITAIAGDTWIPPGRELLFGREARRDDRGSATEQYRSYLVRRLGLNAGPHLAAARVESEPGLPGLFRLRIELDREGAEAFAGLTATVVGERLAVVIDGQVALAPVVRERIDDGRALLTLGDDAQKAEVEAVAAALSSGELPAPLSLASESAYGPEASSGP